MTQPALFSETGMICPYCGASESTTFIQSLNHTVMVGRDLCSAQWLTLNHIRAGSLDEIPQARELRVDEHRIEQAIQDYRVLERSMSLYDADHPGDSYWKTDLTTRTAYENRARQQLAWNS
ncbi:hypothetical protein QVA66_03835 [Staphylococcus chromogenes]|nr:hypothetical protein [Staphylococcus chromogenes]